MSQPEPIPETGGEGPVTREGGERVFAEPWEAQAFALAVKLSELGYFTWNEWSAALAEELRVSATRREPGAIRGDLGAGGEQGGGSRYYDHWLAALERLVTAKGLSNPGELRARKEAWADAYRHTPHGKPVVLAASLEKPAADSHKADSAKAAGSSKQDAELAAKHYNAEPMLYCPVCSTRLAGRGCKLLCENCGYYMSCSDYY